MIELDKIYNEDCLEGMKRIPDCSVDCIICDLPYGTTQNAWDSVIPFDLLWGEYHRIMKPDSPVVLFGAEPFATALRMSNMKEYRYDWIWEKDNSVGFLDAKRRPLRIYENICVFYKSQPTYNPQGLRYNPKVQRRGGTGSNYRGVRSNEYVTEYENYPTNIIFFPKDAGEWHPTQKPVDLLRYLVLTYSNEGDTILDNCSGSGTTAVACVREKRHFICFEKDEAYWKRSVERVTGEQRQLKLF